MTVHAGVDQAAVGRPTLATLDAMRGCAALAVVVLHSRALFGWSAHIVAYLAVDFFFCLSGFILPYAYRHRLAAGLTPGGFLWLRLCRLYPLYLLSLAIALIAAALDVSAGQATIGGTLARLAPELLLVPSGADGARADAFVLNLAAWSLAFELLVNLLWAATWRALTVRRLGLLCGGAGVLMIVVIAFNHSASVGWSYATAPAGLVRVVFDFFCGVLLFSLRRPLPPRAGGWSTALAVVLVLALATLLLSSPSGLLHGMIDVVAVGALCPLFVALGAAHEPTGLLRRVALRLGSLSYALYILHVPLRNLLAHLPAMMPSPLLGLAWLAGATGLAAIADALVDRPIRDLRQRRAGVSLGRMSPPASGRRAS